MSDNPLTPEDIARYRSIVDDLRGDGAARRRAVGRLYDEFAGRIRRYMERAANPAEAEELMQEVFIRVLRSAHTFQGEPRQFPAWLWTTAHNVRIDFLRAKRGGQVELDDDEVQQLPDERAGIDPEQSVEKSALTRCVDRAYAAFETVHPQRAQCLSWLVTDHMPIRQIAELLGRTEAATREYLSQCRKKLRPFLEPCRRFMET